MISAFLLASQFQVPDTCVFGSIMQQAWIGYSMIIVLLTFMLAGIAYALSNLLASGYNVKLSQLAKGEMLEAVLSIAIIALIVYLSSFACSTGASIVYSITGESISPMSYSLFYINNLLFVKGFNLLANIYSTSISYAAVGTTIGYLQYGMTGYALPEAFKSMFGALLPTVGEKIAGFGITFTMLPSPSLASLYSTYSDIITGQAAIVLASFGPLLVLFIMLPLVQNLALLVVVPVSIIMRSIGFLGNGIRESANSILAIGLAFYFILPLTIVLDSYIVAWMFCGIQSCNPYPYYLGQYQVSNIQPSSLLSSGNVNPFNFQLFGASLAGLPTDMFSGGSLALGQKINFLEILDSPSLISSYINTIAQYFFQSIVLVALDFAITIAFALGLAKSFGVLSGLVRTGSFWS